jgi:hypothetical protein
MTDLAAPPRIRFREHAQQTIIRGVRMSHLSIEVGHFYLNELTGDVKSIEERFRQVVPWIAAARASAVCGDKTPRISTCFLLDDYFLDETKPAQADPAEIIEKLLTAAKKAGVEIDYLARESACARIGQTRLAELVLSKVRLEPEPGANGSQPLTQWPGWLSNGKFTGAVPLQAMDSLEPEKPEEYGYRNHSVFLAIELYRDLLGAGALPDPAMRLWSCSFLAAVWQLLRLGLLRDGGEPVVEPVVEPEGWRPEPGSKWRQLPAVVKLNPEAAAFSAYRTLSILPQDYLPIEHAVRQILSHTYIEEPILSQTRERARGEKIELPDAVERRVTHAFIEGSDGAAR